MLYVTDPLAREICVATLCTKNEMAEAVEGLNLKYGSNDDLSVQMTEYLNEGDKYTPKRLSVNLKYTYIDDLAKARNITRDEYIKTVIYPQLMEVGVDTSDAKFDDKHLNCWLETDPDFYQFAVEHEG